MHYTKPYLDIDEQILLLESRGMDIGDRALSVRALSQIGYYRLSAYWYPFREIQNNIRTDQFRDGAKLHDAVALYVFDKKLRLHILDAIERIEIALRTSITLKMGRFGPLAHRDAAYVHGNFNRSRRPGGRTKFQDWMTRLDKCEERSRDEFVTHFRSKYTSERFLPIWISVEVWELGLLSHFLAGMRHADAQAIGQEFGVVDVRVLPSWTRALTFVRNVCAHHGRLWNRAMVDQPRFPRRGQIPEMDHVLASRTSQEKLYGVCTILAYLTKQLNAGTNWHLRTKELLQTFPNSDLFSTSSAGFPRNWAQEALWN